jgi:hypothetical protein
MNDLELSWQRSRVVTEHVQAWMSFTLFDENRGSEVTFKVVTAYDTNLDLLESRLPGAAFLQRGETILNISPPSPVIDFETADVITAIRSFYPDSKINAIKHVRETRKIGLKEAKDLVDSIWSDRYLKYR